MWKLHIVYNPLPALIFEVPESLDGEPAQRHVVSFRFIQPKLTAGTTNDDLIRTPEMAYEVSRSLETATTQIHFPYLAVPVKELFGFNFNAFNGRLKGNLDILQDIESDTGKPYDFIYPKGRERGVKYRRSEANRVFPLYLLHEYIKRLPPTLLVSSGVCMTDVFDMALGFLKSREQDPDDGTSYLFNRLMMENGQKAYYRFLEKHYDSTAVIASITSRTAMSLENQQRDILKLQTQLATLTAMVNSIGKGGNVSFESIMSLK